MSIWLRWFYALRFGNRVRCTLYLYIFSSCIFGYFVTHCPIEYELFLDWSTWPYDGTLNSYFNLEWTWINDNETLHFVDLQNWSHTVGCNLLSYPEAPFIFIAVRLMKID